MPLPVRKDAMKMCLHKACPPPCVSLITLQTRPVPQIYLAHLQMARKKANKRAREQGLPPPGITPPAGGPSQHPKQSGTPGAGPPQQGGAGPPGPPQQGGDPNSKKARKAAAEAALTRFAGFEEHTSGEGQVAWCLWVGLSKLLFSTLLVRPQMSSESDWELVQH